VDHYSYPDPVLLLRQRKYFRQQQRLWLWLRLQRRLRLLKEERPSRGEQRAKTTRSAMIGA